MMQRTIFAIIKFIISYIPKVLCFILGLILTFVVLESGLRVLGHIYHLKLKNRTHTKLDPGKQQITIACFGESMTMHAYPSFLEEQLNRHLPDKQFIVIDKGMSSTDSEYIKSIIDETLDHDNPDIVIVMTGINDTRDKELYGHNTIETMEWYKRLTTYRLFRFIRDDLFRKRTRSDITRLLSPSPEQDNPPEQQNLQQPPKTLNKAEELAKQIEDYAAENELDKAEELFTKAKERFPEVFDTSGYNEFFCRTVINRKGPESIIDFIQRFLKSRTRTFTVNETSWAYDELISAYIGINEFEQAEQTIQKAIKEHPESLSHQINLLAQVYIEQKEYTKAQSILLEHVKTDSTLLPQFLYVYIMTNNSDAIDKLLKDNNITQDNTQTQKNWILRTMALSLLNLKKRKEADALFKTADEYSINNIPQSTLTNYRYIAKTVLERGKILVCMQYPIRNTQILKQVLAPYQNRILFVDNETIFKNAVCTEGCEKIFADIFGGDFGHMKQQGIDIMVDNLARRLISGPLKNMTKETGVPENRTDHNA